MHMVLVCVCVTYLQYMLYTTYIHPSVGSLVEFPGGP